MSDVSQILHAIDAGDPHAAGQLLPLVYDELRKLAAAKMAKEKPGQTLDATGLVHEAYLRLVASPDASANLVASAPGELGALTQPRSPQQFANRRHFFTAAAEAMRRILVDQARKKLAQKRGGGVCRMTLSSLDQIGGNETGFLDLADAMERFAAQAPAKAELVRLRFFTGMTNAEAAELLGVSVATAERWWVFARTWLFAELNPK
jgi:DNA-directed RNA polymerase specialized sigma24 family protein